MKRLGFSILCLAVLAGCSNSSSSKSSDESYSYEFSQNDCPTGKQTFSSKEALCNGLQDETLNKGCARSLRAQEFTAMSCPGTFGAKQGNSEAEMQTLPPASPPSPGVGSGSTASPNSGGSVDLPVSDPSDDWKERVVVKSKEFESPGTFNCNDFLCVSMELGGQTPVSQDKSDPMIMVQNTRASLAPGVFLACTRKFTMSTENVISKATCKVSIDPSASSKEVLISISQDLSPRVVSIDLLNTMKAEWLYESTHGHAVADNQEEVTVKDASGNEKKIQRMQLSCQIKDLKPTSCNFTGVLE